MNHTYVVFQDNIKGLTEIPQLAGTKLDETIQNIKQGCVGYRTPSQLWMYYIYKLDKEKVPLFGTRFDIYSYITAVAGKNVEREIAPNTKGLQYAITHQDYMGWLFTDKLFN